MTSINSPSEAPILEIKDLSVRFRSTELNNWVVKNVSLKLIKGKTTALIGESGSGKSVTAQSILKLLPDHMVESKGQVIYKTKNLLTIVESDLRKIRGGAISMIFQEPMTSLNPLHTVEAQISETLYLHKNLGKTQCRTRCIELLGLVGIQNPEEKLKSYPHELSGGQRQRVMIAMALANDPDILIADEPTTALDVTIQKQVLDLLKDLQKKFNMAILLITHDIGVVENMADMIYVMHQGQIIERDTAEELINSPQQAYTKLLLNSKPKGSPIPPLKSAPILVRADHLKVDYPIKSGFFRKTTSYLSAVNDISFTVKQGQTLGIVGESGSGKTSLGHALLRLIESKGDLFLGEQNFSTLSQKEFRPLRRDIQIVFQDPFGSLSPRMTAAEIIEEGLLVHKIGKNKSERETMVIEAMQDVGLDIQTRHRYPHEFSGGQRQRIAIARALVLKPKCIILDEPTSALDLTVQSKILDLLRDLQTRYKLSYIFISHDLKVIRTLAHQILVMKDGKAIEYGSADDIFLKPKEDYTQKLITAVL